MHFYACPYCDPCAKAHLFEKKMKELECKYENEEVCEDKHKCKKVYKCARCKQEWTYSLKFLREQKRKIKDG